MSKEKTLPEIKVIRDPLNPEPVEILAKEIHEIAEAFRKLQAGSLNKKAIVLLLHAAIGTAHISKKHIELVLDVMPKLDSIYLRKKN